jgi:hypothetical protein
MAGAAQTAAAAAARVAAVRIVRIMMYFLSNLGFGFGFGGVAVDRKLPRSKVS